MLNFHKKEKCGIFAFFNARRKLSANIVVEGLSKLQHRGQESAGISYVDSANKIQSKKEFGFVDEVFGNSMELIKTNKCIGHVRYSTSGGKSSKDHIQPLGNKNIVIAHNGNIPKLPEPYIHDTTFIFDQIAKNPGTLMQSLKEFVTKVPGAYCLCVLTADSMYVIRDRYGIRPLCIAKDEEGTWYVSSESVAFPPNAKKIRDIACGEILQIRADDSTYSEQCYPIVRNHCLFEYIYFLRKDSIADGVHVETFRKNCGKALAQKEPILFDPKTTVVVGAPHTGIPSAMMYASVLGLPYKQLLTKTKKRRTFILPENRDKACDTIYQYSEPDILKKKIVLIDDSIVRGTTLKSIGKQLRRLGAEEIHIRVASPPVISECFFGIDIPTKEELIGARCNCNIEDMKNEMELDSLVYLTVEETIKLMGRDRNFCTGCFTGNYPKSLLDW